MDYLVRPEDEGMCLRDVLRRRMNVSYSAMKSAKWDHRILLNGQEAFVDRRVQAGDVVTMGFHADVPCYTLKPYPLPLVIPYEDEHLLVIDKPAPLASQSSAGHPDDSLENALYAYFHCPADFVYRPVNRLDKGTSGLMVVAKTPHAQHLLQKQLHTSAFQRGYLAVTDGVPQKKAGRLSFPIAKVPEASVKRMVSPEGKPAVTCYRLLAVREGQALLRLQLETGRTHQIRVHLSHIGCPVRGDFLYGSECPGEFPGRFALHSACLTLQHPLTGETLHLSSIPEWAKPFGLALTDTETDFISNLT